MFSIIIPTFNREKLLNRALLSLRNQSYKNFEIIIVDDKSTDGSYEMIKTFNDLNIIYIKNSSNGIIANSRNIGIRKSTQNYIAFLDSDDYWKKNKLEIIHEQIEKYNYEFIFHDMHLINYKNQIKFQFKKRKLKCCFYENLIMKGNYIFNSSVVLKKKLLESINYLNEDKDLVASEDYHAWLNIFKKDPKIKYINKKLGYYHIHDGSLSKKNMYWCTMQACKQFISNINVNQKRKIYARLNYININFQLKNNILPKKKYFIFSIIFGHLEIKLKVLFLFTKSLFKFN